MSKPNVPHRFEFSVELPGTPEQVWQAIATSGGLTSWFMPTDVDERVGGEFTVHMGDVDAPGEISGWEPPHRLVVEEPGWPALAGHDGADVTPLVTEYLVEADSGGSCVLRVVSSAFGTGAEWEREFFEDAQRYWMPMFDHLRVYLNHFPGQRASLVDTGAEVKGTPAAVIATMRERLGASAPGDRIELHGATGEVERLTDMGVLVRLTDNEVGFESLYVFASGEGTAYAGVRGYLFGDGAAARAPERQRMWAQWFNRLPASPAEL
jgi:uncharacterized protein YndB with AHSA1/START domain